jgi:hypothetical protein
MERLSGTPTFGETALPVTSAFDPLLTFGSRGYPRGSKRKRVRMTERRSIQITYRRQTYSGQWWIEGNLLHVTSSIGSKSGPSVKVGRALSVPSELAAQMLWDLARANDPKRPLFYWR